MKIMLVLLLAIILVACLHMHWAIMLIACLFIFNALFVVLMYRKE